MLASRKNSPSYRIYIYSQQGAENKQKKKYIAKHTKYIHIHTPCIIMLKLGILISNNIIS